MAEGNGTPAWMDQLPDDLKSNEVLSQYQTIGDLSAGFLDLEGKHADALFIPGDDASDEDRATFFQRLGRPADPKEYELPLPEGFPEKLVPTEDEDKEYRSELHKLGVTAAQAKGLFDFAMGKAKANWETLEASRKAYHQQNEDLLKKDWGDEFDANQTKANKVIDALGDEGLTQYLRNTQMCNWAPLARLLVNVYDKIGDDAFVEGAPAGDESGDQRPRGVDGKPRFSYNVG